MKKADVDYAILKADELEWTPYKFKEEQQQQKSQGKPNSGSISAYAKELRAREWSRVLGMLGRKSVNRKGL